MASFKIIIIIINKKININHVVDDLGQARKVQGLKIDFNLTFLNHNNIMEEKLKHLIISHRPI